MGLFYEGRPAQWDFTIVYLVCCAPSCIMYSLWGTIQTDRVDAHLDIKYLGHKVPWTECNFYHIHWQYDNCDIEISLQFALGDRALNGTYTPKLADLAMRRRTLLGLFPKTVTGLSNLSSKYEEFADLTTHFFMMQTVQSWLFLGFQSHLCQVCQRMRVLGGA